MGRPQVGERISALKKTMYIMAREEKTSRNKVDDGYDARTRARGVRDGEKKT